MALALLTVVSGGALIPGAEFPVNTVTAGFNSAGTALDAVEFRVNTTAAGEQERPSVAVAPDGRFLVAWQSDQQSGGQGWDIAAQAYNASGTLAGGEILANSTTSGAQTSPRAASLSAPTAGFAVAWEGPGAIFVRRLGITGAAIDAADRQVNTTATGFQRSLAIASDPSGNYAVAWESWDANGTASRILARRFQGVSPLNAADLTIDPVAAATQQRTTAKALSVNVTAVNAPGNGSINLYPGDGPTLTTTMTVSFSPARATMADNAHVLLSRDGLGTIGALASFPGGGTVHLVIDVNGYYQ